MPSRRLALALAAGMGAAACAAQWARPRPGLVSALDPPLDRLFPPSFGDWRIDETAEVIVRPTEDQERVMGDYSQVLERAYVHAHGARIMLAVAEATAQAARLRLHHPEYCYPANGFEVHDAHNVVLHLGGHRVPATCVQAAKPGRQEPVTYWVVFGGKVVGDDDSARLRRLTFGLRGRSLTGMLVRLSSIDDNPAHAYRLHARFAERMLDAIPAEGRARVVGA